MAVPLGRGTRRRIAGGRGTDYAPPQRQRPVLRRTLDGRLGGYRKGAARRGGGVPAPARQKALSDVRTLGRAAVQGTVRRRTARRAGLAGAGRGRWRQDLRSRRLRSTPARGTDCYRTCRDFTTMKVAPDLRRRRCGLREAR